MILILIFMLYIVWQFIKDLAGKELDLVVIAKFIFYILPSLVPLILPLTILVTSIMTFGNFSENYEFAAMKSAGISLQRAMGSLIVFIVILGYTTYQFANTVIPWAEFKSINLRKNLAQVKPAMAIAENRFSDIGDFVIKVDKKTGENSEVLHKVIIHQKNPNRGGNHTVIKSKKGILQGGENPNLISLILYDGNYYNEPKANTYRQRQSKPFVKTSFEEYILNIDISDLNKVDINDESATHPYKGLKTYELRIKLDSVGREYVKSVNNYFAVLNSRSSYSNVFSPQKKVASNNRQNLRKSPNAIPSESNIEGIDSLKQIVTHENNYFKIDSLIKVLPERLQAQVLTNTRSSSNTIVSQIKSKEGVILNKSRILNKIELELHKKYAIGISCIVLFFVGAPLGAIIRKGGLGLPLVVSIILFLVYHFFGLFAGNNAETGRISPFIAAWISTFVMLPVGVYFTYSATNDRQILDIDSLIQFLLKLFRIRSGAKEDFENINEESKEYKNLNVLDNTKLIEELKNYRDYGYSIQHRNVAIYILRQRGYTLQQLIIKGNLKKDDYDKAFDIYEDFKDYSKLTLYLYILQFGFQLSGLFFEELLGQIVSYTLIGMSYLIFALFILVYVKVFSLMTSLSKALNRENITNTILILLAGFPFYIIFYFFEHKKIKEELAQLKH